MCGSVGETATCCAGYSIVGAIFTVSLQDLTSSVGFAIFGGVSNRHLFRHWIRLAFDAVSVELYFLEKDAVFVMRNHVVLWSVP